jgi:hypothetical protein
LTSGGFPTLSELMAWPTDHLTDGADHWTTTSGQWYEAFTQVWQDTASADWQGDAAEALQTRTTADRTKVNDLVDQLRHAASVARAGASDLDAARSRVRYAVEDAQAAGFDIGEDLSVTDRSMAGSASQRAMRQAQATSHAENLGQRAIQLVSLDAQVGQNVATALGGIRNVSFPESPIGGGPLPEDPPQPPPPVPMPPYQPRVWAACRWRGQDPSKVVRTFYRAQISAGFRSLPPGASVLYCGDDKYGLQHIMKRHGPDWQRISDSRMPGAGNWRYLADYAIGATLAYPERVEYNQNNDTFALYRKIFTTDGRYSFTTRVVISASDGKIITAFPTT